MGDGIPAMSAHIRYIFPGTNPEQLEPDDFARLWREAQFIIKHYGLITKHE
jgi:hypothetical protein